MDNVSVLECFAQPMEMEHWCWSMENHVIPWVKSKNKSYWEVVRWTSIHQRRVLKEISREKFCELLITLFKPLLDPGDSPSSLKSSMNIFKFNSELKFFDKLGDSHLLKILVAEVDSLFDKQDDSDVTTTTVVPTVQSRLMDYLYDLQSKLPFARVLLHPTYCNFTATVSMEHYTTKAFFNLGNPTMITVYECVETKVDANVVVGLAGQYMDDRRIKLFIVSPNGYDNRTYSVADNRNVGLIQVDPSKALEDSCFVHWRTMAGENPQMIMRDMLMGRVPMSLPLLIGDGSFFSISMTEVLSRYGFSTTDGVANKAPLYTDDDIEQIAYAMVKNKAEMYVSQLKGFDYHSTKVPYFEIDPYEIARNCGIKVRWKKMRNMADINTRRHEMSLSNNVTRYSNSEAFSVSHEIGHNELHSDVSGVLLEDEKRIMEHQANYFASCLLMPRELVRLMYEIYWKKEYHKEQVRPLFVVHDRYDQSPIVQRIIGPCSRHLNVSMQAMMYRLHDLGLVVFC